MAKIVCQAFRASKGRELLETNQSIGGPSNLWPRTIWPGQNHSYSGQFASRKRTDFPASHSQMFPCLLHTDTQVLKKNEEK